jgi:hypothetical protein
MVCSGRGGVQAVRSAAMFAAMTHPQLTCHAFEVAQVHGLGGAHAGGLDGGVLAVQDVDVLGVVAAWDAGDAGVRDVGAGDGVLQAVFFS